MNKDEWIGIAILLGIVAIGLTGGAQKAVQTANQSPEVKRQTDIQAQITTTQAQVTDLKKQLQAASDAKTHSQYYGKISLQYIVQSDNPNQEYLVLQTSYNSTSTINITGWTLTSTSTGATAKIPTGDKIFFPTSPNSGGNIVLSPGDMVYLVTGISPNGASFQSNKCSGYLSQFQTFLPALYTSCPLPRNENLSSIPTSPVNDDCLDYINSMPACRIQIRDVPVNWTPECTNFIYTKVNYSSCVDAHKSDADFYNHDWRVYLGHSASLWKSERENIILYDNLGKIVDYLRY